ncbi:hypothetical protein KQX54_001205 [Cotesia glomerata]|uniref:Uncharacterized protein n=1 Tax=Cotesia glomerata TaxID=32391 RepID=A0AAV7IIQ0_COTGL|nr:hypothetical protein KQX54_001205 [Cotesia glomerata]
MLILLSRIIRKNKIEFKKRAFVATRRDNSFYKRITRKLKNPVCPRARGSQNPIMADNLKVQPNTTVTTQLNPVPQSSQAQKRTNYANVAASYPKRDQAIDVEALESVVTGI